MVLSQPGPSEYYKTLPNAGLSERRLQILVLAKATVPMSRVNVFTGSERTQGKLPQYQPDRLTTLLSGSGKQNRGICLVSKGKRISSN